mgnify:CR=1 FL=1
MASPAPNPALRWGTAALLLLAAGLAIVLPFLSATVFTLAIGGVAIAAGLLYGLGGLWLLLYPVEGEVSLTLFAGFLLVFQGVTELAIAAAGAGPARGPVLLDGIVTTILGGLLIAEWPSDSLWAVGTLLGIGLGISAINLLTAPSPEAT